MSEVDVEKVRDVDVQVKNADILPEPEKLQRKLRSRHASMLALGGAIGTGLIINSGSGLAHAGPVGLLLAFIYVGSLCYAMMCALGEMAAFLPHQKGFPGHATRFVGPSFGAATGIAYWLKYLIGTATQYSACAVIINYWIPTSKVNNGVWIAIFIVLTGVLQFMPVRYFGEFEFWCSTFKVIVLTGLMIFALVADCGGLPPHEYIGFRTWKQMPFVEYLVKGSLGRFLGFVSALITAIYSYTGSEMVGIALGEMSNPRKNVARAVRACFYRVLFLYCGSIFFVGLIVPANSKLLLAANSNSTNANASPFVVAMSIGGVKVLPHIINAAALIFVASAANSDAYVNSRTAYALAADGNLPKIFLRTNRFGTPWFSVLCTMTFSCLAFTACQTSAFVVFKYFVSAVTLMSTIVWMMIMFTHLRFIRACRVHGIDRQSLPYVSKLNPFLSWWGIIGTGIVSITKGFDAFIHKFNKISFVTNYIAFPVVLVAYVVFSLRYKEWITPIEHLDLSGTRVFQGDELDEEEYEPERKAGVIGWLKYMWTS
ncbi:uncharacterized protein IL334_000033 [Kwoniella shivajii]|uniref:Amino acid permease/ SLC12A domain-containing protein n=1 Tax=Kwoniella shivajii TaxID=564305 RepID=A0ABZ1CN00_9TREE|nr:hypothetical protein IL334_000033 [Kwoniella shivajii]